MAGPRSRKSAYGRARHLYSAGPAHSTGVLEHRHPHRGRRPGDPRRSGGVDGDSGEDSGGHRAPGAGSMTEIFDIAIVGGGMVGASLAVALDGLGVRIALIEAVA